MTSPADPARRTRLIQAIAIAMVVSLMVGAGAFQLSFFDLNGRIVVNAALMAAFNAMAIVFWIVFAVLRLVHVDKSAAVLDFERRSKLGEELYSRARRKAALTMRSSMPGANGTGQP